jgi:hypothetical protein
MSGHDEKSDERCDDRRMVDGVGRADDRRMSMMYVELIIKDGLTEAKLMTES